MKQNIKMLFVVIIMTIVSLLCLTFSVSYSYILRTNIEKDAVKIETGNLTSHISYSPLKDLELNISTDEEALKNSDYSTFTISKDNDYTILYTITIGYSSSSSNLLPLENIKVALYSMDNGYSLNDEPLIYPVRVADLPINSGIDPYNANYTLAYGILKNGYDEKKYALKVWLADDTSSKYDDTDINLGVQINQTTIRSKNFYQLKGQIFNEQGNYAIGAKVLLQNGNSQFEVRNENGYILDAIPSGTWNLSVIYNEKQYDTTINIESGNEKKLYIVHDNIGNANDYLQKNAFTYFTTPFKIMKINSEIHSTNELSTSNYSIPISYKLIGSESIDTSFIENLNINLIENKTINLELVN